MRSSGSSRSSSGSVPANAVSRTASLLAVALFGFLMLNAFKSDLAERLRAVSLSSQARAQLVARSGDLLNLKIPDGASGEARTAIRQAVRHAFVGGFRLVSYLSAGLAAASALAAWLLIAGEARRETDPGGRRGHRDDG